MRYVCHVTEPWGAILVRDDGDMIAVDDGHGIAWWPADDWRRCSASEAWEKGAPMLLSYGAKRNPRETDLAKVDVTKLNYGSGPRRSRKRPRRRGTFIDPIRNPSVRARCEEFHGDGGSCDRYTDTKLWMPGPIVLLGTNVDCGYNVTDSKSSKSGRYVHDHKKGVKIYRRAEDGERASKTLSPPSQVFVLGNWLGCTYDDGDGEQELNGSSRVKACTDNGKRLFAIHSTKGCLYVISGGSFRIRDWMYD